MKTVKHFELLLFFVCLFVLFLFVCLFFPGFMGVFAMLYLIAAAGDSKIKS